MNSCGKTFLSAFASPAAMRACDCSAASRFNYSEPDRECFPPPKSNYCAGIAWHLIRKFQ